MQLISTCTRKTKHELMHIHIHMYINTCTEQQINIIIKSFVNLPNFSLRCLLQLPTKLSPPQACHFEQLRIFYPYVSVEANSIFSILEKTNERFFLWFQSLQYVISKLLCIKIPYQLCCSVVMMEEKSNEKYHMNINMNMNQYNT